MMLARNRIAWITLLLLLAAGTWCWAAGWPLHESKEELGLEYKLSAVDDGGTVLLKLTLSNPGKLGPPESIVLHVHSEEDSKYPRLLVPMRVREDGGRLVAWAQLSRRLADKASIRIVPENPPDGQKVFGWVYFPIKVKAHITTKPAADR